MPRVRRRSIRNIIRTRERLIGQIYSEGQPYDSQTGTARRNRIERIAGNYINNITSLRPVRNMLRAQRNPNITPQAARTLGDRVLDTNFSRNTYAGMSRDSVAK